jgi:hypothetical protein
VDALKFYIMPLETARYSDYRTCGREFAAGFFKHLYNDSSRSEELGEAQLVVAEFDADSFRFCSPKPPADSKHKFMAELQGPDGVWKQSMGNFQHIEERVRSIVIPLLVQQFHDLKANHTFAADAWLVLLDINGPMMRWSQEMYLNSSHHGDVMYVCQNSARTGLPFPRNRGDQDVTTRPFSGGINRDAQTVQKAHRSEKNVNCSAYASGPLAYFQGRGSKFMGMTQTFYAGNDSGLVSAADFRDPHIRTRMNNSLGENKAALAAGIQYNLRDYEFGDFKAFAGKPDYQSSMMTAHFCMCPGGNNPWSNRFIDALSVGCIPAVVSGGSLLPFEPLVLWDRLLVRLEESFAWSDVGALKGRFEAEERRLAGGFGGNTCQLHQGIQDFFDKHMRVFDYSMLLEALKLQWFLRGKSDSVGRRVIKKSLGHVSSAKESQPAPKTEMELYIEKLKAGQTKNLGS